MKKFFLAAMASLAMSCAFAQSNNAKLSIGPEVGLPLGDIHQVYSVTLGGTMKVEVPVSNSNFNVTLTAGYISYMGKAVNYNYSDGYYTANGSVKVPNSGFIPVKIGGKYYANTNFYVEGEVGIINAVSNGSGTVFAYAPGIGVSLPTEGRNAFDLGFRYEGWTRYGNSTNQLALRLAYKFGL